MFNRRAISRNVFVLGWVSLLTDLASEMLYPLIPLFLTGVLGVQPALLGAIEGIAEGISSGLRWIAGALSDRFRSRKPFVVMGYSLSAFSKPLMGLSAYFLGWPLFLLGRSADRLGKSIRTSARDALIAESVPEDVRGEAFGFHRACDTIGAVLGPLAALAILLIKPDFPLAWLFFIALVPGVLSGLLAATAVRDIPHGPKEGKPPSIFQSFPKAFWLLIAANALFSLGNSSDTFLILRSSELGFSFAGVILVYAAYNAIFALGSYPLGVLSDQIGRKPVVIAGWLIYAAVYAGFAVARAPWMVWLLFPLYGLFQALTDGVTKAMISDLVGKQQRAGAIGLFATVSGVGQLLGSIVAGAVWNVKWFEGTTMAAFAIGSVAALFAAFLLMAVPQKKASGHTGPLA